MKEHNQNIQPKMPPLSVCLSLRWPVIVICLFIWAPVEHHRGRDFMDMASGSFLFRA